MTLTRSGFKPKPPAERKPAKEPKRRKKKCALVECRKLFEPRNMGHVACSIPCALAHIEREKARKLKRERQEGLAKLKRRADYLKETQVAFNAYIRQRDRDKLCISSGVPLTLEAVGGGYDCGHYRSVGSAPHLRFDERNAHGQTKKENRYLSGNATAYRVGLIARIGLQAVEELESDDTPRKWSIDDLQAIKATYKAKLRELQKTG